jgi:hypothetical protein
MEENHSQNPPVNKLITSEEWKKKIGLQKLNKKVEFYARPFYDPLPIYQSFNRYPEPITLEKLRELDYTNTDIDKLKCKIKYLLAALILLENNKNYEYSIVYENNELKLEPQEDNKNHAFVLESFDAFADIKIFGATWAYMWCGDLANPEYYCKFEMEKVKHENGSYFTFSDITYENPLFRSSYGSKLYFYTDGNFVTFKCILLGANCRGLIDELRNDHAITHFPKSGRILFNGHMWAITYSCTIDELSKID